MKSIRSLLLGIGALFAACNIAAAQDYPNQRVTIMVPFGAGSVTDIMARILADELSKRWGQQVIVENRAGLQARSRPPRRRPTATR
jgi:tripartite-type tricarboxylate transporter receptor subunit TctC